MQKQSSFINKSHKETLPEAPQVEELLNNLEFHNSILSITNRLKETENLEEIFVNIKEDIRKLFNIYILTIYIIDRPKKEIYSLCIENSTLKEIRLQLNNSSVAGLAANTKRIVHINDAYNDREIRKIHEQLKLDHSIDGKTGVVTGQIIAIPIFHGEMIMGVMEIMNKKGGEKIDDYRQIFLDEISTSLGYAFANKENLPSRIRNDRFDYLIQHGLITEEEMEKAWKKANDQKERIENILMGVFNVYREDIAKALAEYYHCQFIAYNATLPAPHDLLKNIKRTNLESLMWVPLNKVNGKISVILEDPSNTAKKATIEGFLKTKEIKYSVSFSEDILKYIDRFSSTKQDDNLIVDLPVKVATEKITTNKESSNTVINLPEHLKQTAEPIKQTTEPIEQTNEPIEQTSDNIEQLVNKIINDAHERLASDIHIEPNTDTRNIEIRYRVDGACLLYQALPYKYHDSLISYIKVISNLYPSVKGMPQEGKIIFERPTGGKFEWRVATLPTNGGIEDIVLSLLTKGEIMPLEAIGLSKRNYWEMLKLLQLYQGMILFAGPAGSGITTTVHACLKIVNTPEKKICTAEDPVEIKQHGLRQMEIQHQTGLNYSKAIRALLNADPDIIMIGGMPDFATTRICIETSQDGRLVLGAINTDSVKDTLIRLMDMGVDSANFADSLMGILSQKIVRTLCKKCNEAYHPSSKEFEELTELYGKEYFATLNIPYSKAMELYLPKGCDECDQTGYTGKTGIHELLVVSKNIRKMIRQCENAERIKQAAIEEGMITLLQDGIIKTLAGQTDLKQIRRICL